MEPALDHRLAPVAGDLRRCAERGCAAIDQGLREDLKLRASDCRFQGLIVLAEALEALAEAPREERVRALLRTHLDGSFKPRA